MSCRPRGVLPAHVAAALGVPLTTAPPFASSASPLHRAYMYNNNSSSNHYHHHHAHTDDDEESMAIMDYADGGGVPRLPTQGLCSRVALGTLLACCCIVSSAATMIVVAALLQLPHDIVASVAAAASTNAAPTRPPSPPSPPTLKPTPRRQRRQQRQRSVLRRLAMLEHATPPEHGVDMGIVARVFPRWVDDGGGGSSTGTGQPVPVPAWRVDDALTDMALALSYLARAEDDEGTD